MSNKQLGELIAQGRTADIHAWRDDHTVVKLYHNWFQLAWIEAEADRSREVQKLDFPTPTVGELVQVNGRNGLIFERIEGKNMLDQLLQKPELGEAMALRSATLHVQLHAVDATPNIPHLHQKLANKIKQAAPLSESLKTTLLKQLAQMPDGRSVCHGDFHPGNIMTTGLEEHREVIVDWNDCTFGNPLADVARSTILILGGITGNETPNPAFEQLVLQFHQHYLTHYFELSSRDKDEYKQWLPIVAGARLNENITALEPWLLSEAEKINR